MLPAGAIDRAYAAQEINTKRWLAAGRRLVGRKIGLTSLAVQRQLGVDQPDYGMLFDDMAVLDGWDVAADQLIQPKVEAEIAFVIGRDLDHERLTIADLLRAVEFALPAIEIVDSRIADWKIGILDTIADNASSGLYVLGASPKKLDGLELRLCGMVMEMGGEEVSVGRGRGLSRRSSVGDALARQNNGEGRTAAESGRHGDVGRARADGHGQARRSLRSAHIGPRLGPRGLCEG